MTVPPGLENDGNRLRQVVSGGEADSWIEYTKVKFYTNAFIFHNDKVLLGYKKRGFGSHKYNGFGGKVEPGETSLEAAARELEEEAGINSDLQHVGVLFFLSEGEETAFHIDIYRGDGFEGTVTETEEMRPEWFSTGDLQGPSAIPYDSLWESDPYWFPLLLSKTPFRGRADYQKDSKEEKLLPCKWWFGELEL